RQVREVALEVHLALLAVARRGPRHPAEHARTDALGDGLDRTALDRPVAPIDHDADLDALVDDPLQELDQLRVELGQLLGVRLLLHVLFPLSGSTEARPGCMRS